MNESQSMKQHFKGIIWPRKPLPANVRIDGKRSTKTVYRYAVVGVLITTEPLASFENQNERVIDSPITGMAEALQSVKTRKPKFKTGDATMVLLRLDNL